MAKNWKTELEESGLAAWRQFQWFRHRFFPLRLILLLVLGFFLATDWFLVPRTAGSRFGYTAIQELVHIACQAIRLSSEPKVWSVYDHTLRARANAELKPRLLARRAELTPEELAALESPRNFAEFPRLFAAAQRLGLEPYRSQTLSTVRRAQWDQARTEIERETAPEWAEVDCLIAAGRSPLLSWSSLKANTAMFFGNVWIWLISPLPGLLLAAAVAYGVSGRDFRGRKWWGLALGVATWLLLAFFHPTWVSAYFGFDSLFCWSLSMTWGGWLMGLSYLLLALAAAGAGCRFRLAGTSAVSFLGWSAVLGWGCVLGRGLANLSWPFSAPDLGAWSVVAGGFTLAAVAAWLFDHHPKAAGAIPH